MIEAHGEDFDEMNVATCFHELAKLSKDKSDKELEEMHVHETFQTLVGGTFLRSLLPPYIQLIPSDSCKSLTS